MSRTVGDLSGAKVTVMGLGRFGGGLGATKWLAGQGAEVLVTDLNTADKLSEPLADIRPLVDSGQVTLRLGEHNVSDFTTCDLVVANPAVPRPWDNRFLRAADAAGIPVTTEIALTLSRLPSWDRVAAVTGTAGKSTTAALLHHILHERQREAVLGGNIGGSLLETDIGPGAFVVLELSSFMLYWLDREHLNFRPRIAGVTNLSANHLDWHGTLEHYRESKQELLRHQRTGDTAVLGETVSDWPSPTDVRRIIVSPGTRVPGLAIPGRHNEFNAAAAIEAAIALDPT